jgi:hypothetical protein
MEMLDEVQINPLPPFGNGMDGAENDCGDEGEEGEEYNVLQFWFTGSVLR